VVIEPVAAVVVSYNRRELLLETLAALRDQTSPPAMTIVVDNASSDGSAEAASEAFPDVSIVRLPENVGGAGGFAAGLASAIEDEGAALVWLMDDDTVPTPTALHELLAARRHAPAGAEVFASEVRWTDGRLHPMNMPRVRPFASARSRAAAAAFDCYPIRSASFVSILVDARAVRRVGLPIADYFLWNDDFEFTARILRRSRGYVCRRSRVIHKTRVFGSTDVDPGARFYLEVRNKVWVILRSPGLSAPERLLYAVSSVRRWLTTFANSSDRALLWDGLRRGLGDGLRTAPRSTADVLAGDAGIARGAAAIDGAAERRRRD
jgi:GT2 family glycosyltransferase